MFRLFVRSCAATLLLGASALAVDVAGTFTTQTPQGPLVVELRPDGAHLSGMVHYVNHDFPMIAGQSGNQLAGTWQAGQANIPIQGSFDGTTLTLTTNGTTYHLLRAGAVNNAQPATETHASGKAASLSPLLDGDVQLQTGRVFAYPAPRGWRVLETDAGVDLIAPDGATSASHMLIRGIGEMLPDAILQIFINAAPQSGIRNIRVISAQPAPAEMNGNAKAYELTYEFNGVPVRALGILTAYPQPGGAYFAEAIMLQAPPATFKRDVQTLLQLAQNIAICNVAGAFGNGRVIHLRPEAGNPIGDMIVKGEQARNRMHDAGHLHVDDAIRGQTRWETPDGKQIVADTTAARVFNTPGGNAVYTTHQTDVPPLNAEEAHPYSYNR